MSILPDDHPMEQIPPVVQHVFTPEPSGLRPPLDEVVLWTQVLRISLYLKENVWPKSGGTK